MSDTNVQPGGVDESLAVVDSGGCHYCISQPAPSQWVAVGVTTSAGNAGSEQHRMLVGVGRSEAAAVRSLRRRCSWSG